MYEHGSAASSPPTNPSWRFIINVPFPQDLLLMIEAHLSSLKPLPPAPYPGAQDGQDIQDDYTIPIEKKLWGKPLDSILRPLGS